MWTGVLKKRENARKKIKLCVCVCVAIMHQSRTNTTNETENHPSLPFSLYRRLADAEQLNAFTLIWITQKLKYNDSERVNEIETRRDRDDVKCKMWTDEFTWNNPISFSVIFTFCWTKIQLNNFHFNFFPFTFYSFSLSRSISHFSLQKADIESVWLRRAYILFASTSPIASSLPLTLSSSIFLFIAHLIWHMIWVWVEPCHTHTLAHTGIQTMKLNKQFSILNCDREQMCLCGNELKKHTECVYRRIGERNYDANVIFEVRRRACETTRHDIIRVHVLANSTNVGTCGVCVCVEIVLKSSLTLERRIDWHCIMQSLPFATCHMHTDDSTGMFYAVFTLPLGFTCSFHCFGWPDERYVCWLIFIHYFLSLSLSLSLHTVGRCTAHKFISFILLLLNKHLNKKKKEIYLSFRWQWKWFVIRFVFCCFLSFFFSVVIRFMCAMPGRETERKKKCDVGRCRFAHTAYIFVSLLATYSRWIKYSQSSSVVAFISNGVTLSRVRKTKRVRFSAVGHRW